jgi:hypothetical protein
MNTSPPSARLRLAAGCGGALFGLALIAALGGTILWLWVKSAAEATRNDAGFAGYGIAMLMIGGTVVLAILGLITGAVVSGLCLQTANETGRLPTTSLLGFPLGLTLLLFMGYIFGPLVRVQPPIAAPTSYSPPPTRSTVSQSPAQSVSPSRGVPPRQTVEQIQDNTVRYAAPEVRPTPEQIEEYARQAERDAPSVLGEWLYPGARAIPFTPRPGEIPYPILGLETTDNTDTVVAFYERLAPGGTVQGEAYVLLGKRPSDDRQTQIRISSYKGKTFIRFDAR